ncbi:MAG: hypothetical protein OJF55_002848 [Rhodanobacteraceae bacterium]|jgi:hypothetical protein|nr:MAG: hypothetical protein OJF55_002848 [Rhodanobacteraceae bacterium]
MDGAGRGDELTAHEKAAHLLAAGFGCGSGWTRNYIFGKAQSWRPVREGLGGYAGDENRPAAADGLPFGHETETLELAHRAIHPRKLPKWVERLPEKGRNEALVWSASHPLTGSGANRVREFEHWKTSARFVCTPSVESGADAAAAMAFARLPTLPAAVLELYALQRMDHADLILRCLVACGSRPEIASDALARWLWPDLVGTFGECAKARHIRKADYCRAVNACVERLQRWLHRASVALLHAYGIGNQKPHLVGVIGRKEARRPVTSALARRAA